MRYFTKLHFSNEQITQYLNNASRDLEIAEESGRPEVKFNYAYTALIKIGITLLAAMRNIKVRAIQGHHAKVIAEMSDVLNDGSIEEIGNVMRMKRNQDLYSGGIFVSEKEASDYYGFVEKVFLKAKTLLKKK